MRAVRIGLITCLAGALALVVAAGGSAGALAGAGTSVVGAGPEAGGCGSVFAWTGACCLRVRSPSWSLRERFARCPLLS